MAPYGEYLTRSEWSRSDKLQQWVARSTIKELLKVSKLDPKTSDILEIGSGVGRGAIAARSLGFQSYEGVEPTKNLADYSRRNGQFKVVDDSLPHLVSYSDGQFDAVFSIHVLEHADGPYEARAWCEEMLRVTKNGGFVVIAAPNVLEYGKYFWDTDWTHRYPTTPRRVSQIFNSLGAEVIFKGNIHLGRTNSISALAAHVLAILLPTRMGDLITEKFAARPLVSGFKIAALWGLTFVVAKKPHENL